MRVDMCVNGIDISFGAGIGVMSIWNKRNGWIAYTAGLQIKWILWLNSTYGFCSSTVIILLECLNSYNNLMYIFT